MMCWRWTRSVSTDRGGSRSNEIPHRLMVLVRNPDRRKLTGAQQFCKADRVAAVRLHIPPAEAEASYYAANETLDMVA